MNTFTTTHNFLAVTVAAAALLVGAGLATAQAAEDRKYYPGSLCRHVSTGTYVSYGDDDSIVNRSEQFSLKVVCPIIRDTYRNKDGLESIRIRYYDNHNRQNLTCEGFARKRSGNRVVKEVSGYSTKHMGLGEYVIEGPNPHFGWVGIYYTLSCSIPPKLKGKLPSKLLNYAVTEGDED